MLGESRYFWQPSPDTEETRQHLLDLLEEISRSVVEFGYPLGHSLGEIVVWQLGDFREQRATEALNRLIENGPDYLAEAALEALARSRRDG